MNKCTWDPLKCDQAIYDRGQIVLTVDAGKTAIENFVKALSEKSGVMCDWHYMGGHGIIKTLPENLKAAHDAVCDEAWMQSFLTPMGDDMDVILKDKTWFSSYSVYDLPLKQEN